MSTGSPQLVQQQLQAQLQLIQQHQQLAAAAAAVANQQQQAASGQTAELGDSQRFNQDAGERNRPAPRRQEKHQAEDGDSNEDSLSSKAGASPARNRKRAFKHQLPDKDQSDVESELDEQPEAEEERMLRMVASQQQQLSLLRKRRLSSHQPVGANKRLALTGDIGEQISERVGSVVSSSELGGQQELDIRHQQLQFHQRQQQRKQKRTESRPLSPGSDNGQVDESGAQGGSPPTSADELDHQDAQDDERAHDSDHKHDDNDHDEHEHHDDDTNHSAAESDRVSLGSGKRSPTRQAH